MRKLTIFALLFCVLDVVAETEYTDGVFVLNEDWYGHRNSTINRLIPDGSFDYRIVQAANSDTYNSLGCTTQFGTIYGGKFYFISKQNQDPGETENWTGGRFVVADAKTMRILHTQSVIFDINGKSAADGRSFVGVDETKGYIGTSNGIFIVDLVTYQIKGRIVGTENPLIDGTENNGDGTGPLYRNQIGLMIRTHDYVFAVQQDKGILIIDPQTDQIITTIEGCFSTMTQSKDGNVWAARNTNTSALEYPYGTVGEKWQGNELLCINPSTLEQKTINIAERSGNPDLLVEQTWYAWTAGSLCASTHENVLYFAFNDNIWSWFTKSHIYKYNIDDDEISEIYDTQTDDYYIYGSGIRINPLDDKLYVACYKGSNVSTQNWTIFQYSNTGILEKSYTPIKNYWYPSMFVFPDNYEPVVCDFSPIKLSKKEPVRIALSAMCSDKDNLVAAITKKVVGVSNNALLEAVVRRDTLIVNAKQDFTTDEKVTIRFNSNGKMVDKILIVSCVPPSAVESVTEMPISIRTENGRLIITGITLATDVKVFDMLGRLYYGGKLNSDFSLCLNRGIYLLSINGSLQKIVVK